MTPEQLAKSGSESGEQRAVFCWCAMNINAYPELKHLFHIPNGGSRGDDAKSRAIRGAALKAEGVKSGVADLFLPVPRGRWHGLFIEMKKRGQKVKKGSDQAQFGADMQALGYGWCECDSWEKAVKILIEYLGVK